MFTKALKVARSVVRSLGSVIETLTWASGGVATAVVFILMVIVCYQVATRVIGIPVLWTLEIGRYFLICSVFVAAAYLLKKGGHIRVDMVVRLFSSRVQLILRIITSALSFVFCGILVWQGWELVMRAYHGGYRAETVLGTPLFLPYLLVPIGIALFALQFVVEIGHDIQSLQRRQAGSAEAEDS